MFVIGNLLLAVAKILNVALTLYMWIIIARAVLSWVSPDPKNRIVQLLYQVTEPVLWQIRRRLPLRGVSIDISPIIVILAILFVRYFLIATLFDIARRL
jgi:YggT family protein